MRKDSELFLKKVLEYRDKIGENSFQLNIDYFSDIPNIIFALKDILDDLIFNHCISGHSQLLNNEFDIQIYLTLEGLKYFDNEKKENSRINYTINMSGGQLNFAEGNGTVNSLYRAIIDKKELDVRKVNNVNKKRVNFGDNRNISLFISYSSKDKSFVDKLDDNLQKYGYKVIRDIRDAKYVQSIKEFMKRIRKTDFSLIIISDKFLKSENCMREIFEFIKDENYKDRIIPIILKSAKGILENNKGIEYTVYWKEREEKLKEQLKLIDDESKSGYIEELKHISMIKDSIGEVLGLFRDMKMFKEDDGNIQDKIFQYIKKKEI